MFESKVGAYQRERIDRKMKNYWKLGEGQWLSLYPLPVTYGTYR
jgi:hypothetical protein